VDEMQPLVARASAAPPQSAVRVAWLVAAAAVVAVVVVAAVAAGSVGFHTLFSVPGDSALANVALLTPGGVGVNRAFHVASLHEAASAATASAYSVAHQLLSTVWNIVLAAVLVVAAFGGLQGKRLVEESRRMVMAARRALCRDRWSARHRANASREVGH
jgi:hypothetical protein